MSYLKMKEILLLDMRKQGSREALHNALRQLPFFSEDVIKLVDIETAVGKMAKKYPITLAYIMFNHDDNYCSMMVKRTDNHKHLITIYGQTLQEGMAKVAIYMFGYINNVLKKEQSK